MLDGWYCRSMANANTPDEDDEPSEPDDQSKYRTQYRTLKRKLKHLIYENESFQETLRQAQRRLLTVTRDRNFLLDRLLSYERVDVSSSESEDTESSEDETAKVEVKKKKIEYSATVHHGNGTHHSISSGKGQSSAKRKRPTVPKQPKPPTTHSSLHLQTMNTMPTMISDGHMTPEEVERHLQSRQSYMELVPEKAPPTVPTEMFSNDPSLDSESNDVGELETSPSNMGEDLSVDMINE